MAGLRGSTRSVVSAPFCPAAIAARSKIGGGVSPPMVPDASFVVSELLWLCEPPLSCLMPTAPRFSLVLSASGIVLRSSGSASRNVRALPVIGTWPVLGRGGGGGPGGRTEGSDDDGLGRRTDGGDEVGLGGGGLKGRMEGGRDGGVVTGLLDGSSGSSVPSSRSSAILSSSVLRAADPGTGGGVVLAARRGASRTVRGSGAAGAGGEGPSTVHPDAKSAMRPFVSSPRRRPFRSSSGTPCDDSIAPRPSSQIRCGSTVVNDIDMTCQ